jgi:hypothetical protein
MNNMDKENITDESVTSANTSAASKDVNKTTEPTLICGQFQEPLWLGFGCVKINSVASKRFQISNPTPNTIRLAVEKVPSAKGFRITLGNQNLQQITLNPNEFSYGIVEWVPDLDMCVRETITLSLGGKMKLQVTVHGIAGIGEVRIYVYNVEFKCNN